MSPLSQDLLSGKKNIAVVGLGYVGLPLVLAFAKRGVRVIGFDTNEQKVKDLERGRDVTGECAAEDFRLSKPRVAFTSNPKNLSEAQFIIVAVPTPIDENKSPDLVPLKTVSECLGRHIRPGCYIVFESTVYPGVTEEICLPIIEKFSGFSSKQGDFFIGYSPERINPGDRTHTLETTIKIVSGQNAEVCDAVASVYEIVVGAGTHRATSIKVAEAAKVIENTQRDLNIALMNELAIIFNKIGISTEEVLNAAGTKWNFLKFHPGLVGGHCIGVDPYYLTSKAEQLGYHPQVVLAGRRINDSMGHYVAQETIKNLIQANKVIRGANLLVMGLTFKEDVPDIRNSRVFDILDELRSYGTQVSVYDPHVSKDEVGDINNLVDFAAIKDMDGIILATPHKEFREMGLKQLRSLCRVNGGKPVLVDVRWLFNKAEAEQAGFHYLRL